MNYKVEIDALEKGWNNTSATIVEDLMRENEIAFSQGKSFYHAILNSVTLQWILHNKGIQVATGKASDAFESFNRSDSTSKKFQIALRALPWLTFNVVDDGTVADCKVILVDSLES